MIDLDPPAHHGRSRAPLPHRSDGPDAPTPFVVTVANGKGVFDVRAKVAHMRHEIERRFLSNGPQLAEPRHRRRSTKKSVLGTPPQQ